MLIVPYGIPGDQILIERVVEAVKDSPAVLLQNHGLLTIGWTLRHAANRALALEEVIRILLVCRSFEQEPATMPEEMVALLRETGAL
jgi:ribulose-5-phosphate 4-epimerase/fuculose-1-phosphate aldolase